VCYTTVCRGINSLILTYTTLRQLYNLHITNLPLLDHGAQFVCCHVHAVEVGQHIAALDFLRYELELAECHLVVLKVGERHFKHAAFQRIGRNLCTFTTTHIKLSKCWINLVRCYLTLVLTVCKFQNCSIEFERSMKKRIAPSTQFSVHNFGRPRTKAHMVLMDRAR